MQWITSRWDADASKLNEIAILKQENHWHCCQQICYSLKAWTTFKVQV